MVMSTSLVLMRINGECERGAVVMSRSLVLKRIDGESGRGAAFMSHSMQKEQMYSDLRYQFKSRRLLLSQKWTFR